MISSWIGSKGNQIRLRNTLQRAKSLLIESLGKHRWFFDWYPADFGADNKNLIKLIALYVDDSRALYLLGFKGDSNYVCDVRTSAPEVIWPL